MLLITLYTLIAVATLVFLFDAEVADITDLAYWIVLIFFSILWPLLIVVRLMSWVAYKSQEVKK